MTVDESIEVARRKIEALREGGGDEDAHVAEALETIADKLEQTKARLLEGAKTEQILEEVYEVKK